MRQGTSNGTGDAENPCEPTTGTCTVGWGYFLDRGPHYTDFVNSPLRSVRLATLPLIAALSMSVSASQAWAQEKVKFMSGPYAGLPIAFGSYVGRYTGTLQARPGAPTIDLYCIDYINDAHFGKVYYANVTNLGNNAVLNKTRRNDGNLGPMADGADALDIYRKAAWLTSFYKTTPMTSSGWGNLQAAIWELFNPGNPNGGANANVVGTEAWWLKQVNTFYADQSSWNGYEWGKYSVITDSKAKGLKVGGFQEFITDVEIAPEPGTMVLLGTGLLAVAGMAVRRRKAQATAA